MRPIDPKKFFGIFLPTLVVFVLVIWRVDWLNDHIFIRALMGGGYFAFVCWLRMVCVKPYRRKRTNR
ncbi:MAG: hypothetical protein ACOX4I_02045 [Anaerovoracaceae bacterium]|jgi:hypothetical protein